MAQSTDKSLLDKLLKSRYPLTNYLYRQQEFIKNYSTVQSLAVPIPPPESALALVQKPKVPLPPPSCFNVPDTLDFNATGYEKKDEMDQSSGIESDSTQQFDDTLFLKSIENQINDSDTDLIFGKNQRSSSLALEFSPYECNSPLQKAIEKGLNILNK